ncbi:MAG: lasso RiPP family leader peptide-containing protein [Pseudonocardiaceae bacterium]
MENPTYEQIAVAVYEPPVLVEMGEFSTDALSGGRFSFDGNGGQR